MKKISNKDITSRLDADEILKETEEKYRLLLESCGKGVGLFSLDGKVLFFNQKSIQNLGGKAEDYVGKSLIEVFGQEVGESYIKRIKETVECGNSTDYEDYISSSSGNYWFLSNHTPMKDCNGEIIGVQVSSQDITKQKNIELNLEYQIELQKLLMDFSTEFISLPLAEIGTKISDSLAKIGRFVDADRSYVFSYDFDNQTTTNTYEWCSEGVGPEINNLQQIPIVHLSDLRDAHCKGETVLIPDVSELESNSSRGLFGKEVIKSQITVPMIKDGNCIGFVGFDSVKKHHVYSEIEKKSLKLFAQILVNIEMRKYSDQEMQNSRTRLSSIIQTIPDLIWLKDINGVYLSCNSMFERFFGTKESQIVGKTDFNFIDSEQARFFQANDRNALNAGKPTINEETITFADDRHGACLEVIKTPMFDSEGNVIGVLGIGHDITGRKNTELVLIENESKLSEAIRIANLGFWEYDVDSDMFTFNDQFYKLLHTTSKEEGGYLMSSSNYARKFVHPDDMHLVADEIQKTLQVNDSNYSSTMDHRIVCADGQLKYITVSIRIVKGKQGSTIRIKGVNQDITARKQSELTLLEKEVQYRNLANSGMALIWTSGVDKLCNYFNEPWLKFTGRTLEHELGNGWAEGVHPDDFDLCLETYITAFDKREVFSMEYRLKHVSGDYRWVLDMGTPNYNVKREFVGYIGYCFDITVRKQSEDALARERYLMNALMNNLPDYIYFKDKESRFVNISYSLAHLFELSVPAEAIGKTDFDFFSEEHARQAYNDEQGIIRLGKPLVKEEKETWPDRPDTWVSTTKLPLLNQEGEIVGTFGVSRDITERIRAEEALKESDRLLHESQEVAGLGSYAWDITNGLWTSTKILDRIFGINESYVRSLEGWLSIIHPDFRELMQNYITDEVLENQQKFDKEYQIINQENGQERWVNGLGRLEFDSNHMPIKLIGTIQDITERKETENEILANSKRLKALVEILQYPFNSTHDYLDFALNKAIEITDSKIGFIFFYNEEKKEFVLNSWSNEVMKECAIAEKQTIWQLENAGLWGEAVRQRKPIVVNDYQMPNPLKKGLPEGHAPLHKFLIIPMLENDKIVCVVAVANKKTDYTDNDVIQLTVLMDIVWKALEKNKSDIALRENEEKLSTLFGSMTEMVATHEFVFNEKGEAVNYRITDCNNAFTAITGIKKEDAIGKLVTEVYQTDTPPHLEEFTQVAITGNPYEFIEYFNDIDKYLMISVISPSRSKFSTIVTDITVIQKIQEEIKDKNKELENYLYVASHDLRSPLVNIQGFSQRFKKQSDAMKNAIDQCTLEPETKQGLDKLTNEDIPKTLNFILSNVTKMETLISGLLQISRTGRVVMTIKKVNMNQLIKTIIAGANFQITELSAKVIVEDLPECYGDENLINQLFANIISNALKYRDPNRQLVIEIDSHAQFNKVIYSIKDTGIGIETRHLEKIWDVFYRVDPGSEVPGDGIGLNVVKRIVEKHKGKIWVESEVGKGSVFYIELQKNEFVE